MKKTIKLFLLLYMIAAAVQLVITLFTTQDMEIIIFLVMVLALCSFILWTTNSPQDKPEEYYLVKPITHNNIKMYELMDITQATSTAKARAKWSKQLGKDSSLVILGKSQYYSLFK